ncbi:hypothetical protein GCM10010324_41220 [Streptomyces hiroshimensis]|uniref:Uncharacterized protein n=1 Tax=Streptomyces hiroshimensis TaxID=66424 RepID=A0ABQ2YQL3_9ACTN|nr:hypothetical protein GCM10010324_41220 [Streptomyces hiroshimensis]
MAPVLRGGDLQLEIAGERMDQDITGTGTGGGGRGVDHEERTHARQPTYLSVHERPRPAFGPPRIVGATATLLG